MKDLTRLQRWLLIPLVMLGLATLCYWPALRGEFVWDDENLVAVNPFIRSPILIGEMFEHWLQPGINSPYYRPVQTVSMAIDYYFWKLDPLGYHLSNVALHAACGVLLFFLARRLLRNGGTNGEQRASTDWVALGIATIWLIHPIHNAAVAYISGRADPLGFLFACGGWLLFASAKNWKSVRILGYIGAALLGLAALCSKEIAAVWLALFAVHSLFVAGISWRDKFVRLASCLVVLIVWLLMRELPVEPPLPAETIHTTLPQRVVLVTRAVADYASLIVFPGELHMERILWPEWFVAKTNWRTLPIHMGWTGWIGLLVIACVILGCCIRGPGRHLRIGGSIWFSICFLPISNVIPLNAQGAEHWIYLASVGAFGFLAGVFLLLPSRIQTIGTWAILAWSCGLIVRTNLRAAEWRDPVVFYSSTIASMGGTPRVFNNLGTTLQRRGRIVEAEQIYRLALERYPNSPSIIYNLGTLLGRKGSMVEAEALFAQAREIAAHRQGPGDDRALIRALAAQARVFIEGNRPQDAVDLLEQQFVEVALPWELARLKCEAFVMLGRRQDALALIKKRTEMAWWDKDARALFARMLERTGDLSQAEREWRQTARLDVWDPEPWAALARIHKEKGDILAAVRCQQKVVERAPDIAFPRFALAVLLSDAGHAEQAADELLKARYLQAGGKL